jgi:hypothetical protein
MLRALGISRYVGDRLRRERRFRIVASGKALFVPVVDVERLRAHLSEQDQAKDARDAVADLPWFERAREHRLPIALGRNKLFDCPASDWAIVVPVSTRSKEAGFLEVDEAGQTLIA